MPISSLRASPAVHQTWKDHLPHWSQISYITSQMFSCWRITCEELWSSLFQENFYNQMVHPCWGNDKDNKPLKKIPSFTRHTVFVKTKEKNETTRIKLKKSTSGISAVQHSDRTDPPFKCQVPLQQSLKLQLPAVDFHVCISGRYRWVSAPIIKCLALNI